MIRVKENYLVSITGKQITGNGNKTSINVVTPASYVTRGNSRYIIYKEYSAENTKEYKKAVIKVSDDNVITIIKGGPSQTRLILEENKRHSCYYYTDVGSLILGIYTSQVKSKISDRGCFIKAKYFLDLNSVVTSSNEIEIKVKEKRIKNVESDD